MKQIVGLASFIIMAFVFTGPALAVDSPNYFAGNVGGFIPTGDLEGEDSAVTGNLVGGHYFSDNVALEFGIGGVFTSYSFEGYRTGGLFSEEDYYVNIVPVTLTVKGFIPASDAVEFYGGLGIGVYRATFRWEAYYPSLGREFEDTDRDTVFGGHSIIGANLYPGRSKTFFVNIQAKYTVTDEAHFSVSDTNGGVTVTDEWDPDLDGLGLTFGVGFRF